MTAAVPDEDKDTELAEAYLSEVTRQLRRDGWRPQKSYLCGCNNNRLCAPHTNQRAADHYSF